MSSFPQGSILLIDGCHGINIPRDFAAAQFRGLTGVSSDVLEFLLVGPSLDGYWDLWDEVLSNARLRMPNGIEYNLYQDGDLWAIPVDAEWPDDAGDTESGYGDSTSDCRGYDE